METFGTLLSGLSIDPDGSNPYTLGGRVLWQGKTVRKDQIEVIRIGIPSGGMAVPSTAQDVSEEKGGTIQAWVSAQEDGLTLFICSKGGIAAHYNSQYLFAGYSRVKEIAGLDNINTESVKYMDGMFRGCTCLSQLDLSGFDTSETASFNGMFEDCEHLLTLDLRGMSLEKARNMDRMFYGCRSLRQVHLSHMYVNPGCSFRQMFTGCHDLEIVHMFSGQFDRMEDLSQLFAGCHHLKRVDLGGLSFPHAMVMNKMFACDGQLETVVMPQTGESEIKCFDEIFFDCSRLKKMDLSGIRCSAQVQMNRMFFGCSGLTGVILPDMGESLVIQCRQMFYGCSALTQLDLSMMEMGRCLDLRGMFDGCEKLEKLDLTGTHLPLTGAPEQFACLLTDCPQLKELKLSDFLPDPGILLEGRTDVSSVRTVRMPGPSSPGVHRMISGEDQIPYEEDAQYSQGVIFDLSHHLLLRKMLIGSSQDAPSMKKNWVQELQLPYWCRQGDFVFFTVRENQTDQIVAMGRILSCEYPETSIGEMNRNQTGIKAQVGELTAMKKPVSVSGILHSGPGGSVHFKAIDGDDYDQIRSRIFAWNRMNRSLDESVPVPVALRAIGPENWAYAGAFWKNRFRNTAEYINYYLYYLLEDLFAGSHGPVIDRKQLDELSERQVMRFLLRTGPGYIGILSTLEVLDEDQAADELDAEHSFYSDTEVDQLVPLKSRPYFWCYRHMLIADAHDLFMYDKKTGIVEKLAPVDEPWTWSEMATVKARLYSVLSRYRYQKG